MTAVEALDHKVLLYKSSNLKDWTELSAFGPANATGGLWECPDLFPLAMDGNPDNVKWVMVVNNEPGNWKNGPFGNAPAPGTLAGQMAVPGYAGAGLVSSFNDGDWPLGSVSSPEFTVSSDYINFLVGGGQHPRGSDKLDNAPPAGDLLFSGFEVPDGSTLADAGWTGTADLAPASQPATAGGDYFIGAKRINTFERVPRRVMTARAPLRPPPSLSHATS
jgi:fructan beta-fructosidase